MGLLSQGDIQFELEALWSSGAQPIDEQAGIKAALTDCQRQVAQAATRMGYYDKGAASAKDVAAELDIAPSTLSSYLRSVNPTTPSHGNTTIVVVRFSICREVGSIVATLKTLSSETAKLVYLYLCEQGPTTDTELRKVLDIPLLKLLPVLQTLQEKSLVEQQGTRYIPTEKLSHDVST
jgi:hypothetical protein